MSDVFISYARSSERQATHVEAALRHAGYAVWRDTELPAHRTYAEVIEERLSSAKAVVVLWSAEATKSQWVRAEADTARELGTLVQASIDGTMPPIPFNQIQTADLNGWDGSIEAAGWRKLEASVAALAAAACKHDQPPKPQRHKRSICVLPFANMSGDSEQEYFSDGISEDITTDLSKVSALEVIARNTAFIFKGASVDVPTIAKSLGVSHVLEGSVRKAGNRVRITAQLIDGGTGAHVWADRYDRDLDDIFAIQDEISKAIVEALKIKLLPGEKKAIENRGTTSAEAYNLYLMARQFWITGNHGDVRREERVIRICERAVEIDPNYARAWALIALAQVNLRFWFGQQGDGGLQAANRTLTLDPTIAEAYCVKARNLLEDGHMEESEEQVDIALELDPDSWEVNKEAGRLCMARRDIEGATRHYEKAVEVMENDYHAWAMLLTCYDALNDKGQAVKAAEMMFAKAQEALEHDPSNGSALGIAAGGLAALGQQERAREWIERAMLMDPGNLHMRYNFACILAVQLGDADAALDLLEASVGGATPMMIRLAEKDPDFDSIRNTRRFQKIIAEAKSRLTNSAN